MYQHAEIVHWMKNKDRIAILPAQVDIDLTNICNQDCFYCNSAEHRASRPIQKKYYEYIELLDKLVSWRAHTRCRAIRRCGSTDRSPSRAWRVRLSALLIIRCSP